MTRHHSGERLHPIAFVLLLIPALMLFGMVKGCQMVEDVVSQLPTTQIAPAETPRAPHVEKAKGWNI